MGAASVGFSDSLSDPTGFARARKIGSNLNRVLGFRLAQLYNAQATADISLRVADSIMYQNIENINLRI